MKQLHTLIVFILLSATAYTQNRTAPPPSPTTAELLTGTWMVTGRTGTVVQLKKCETVSSGQYIIINQDGSVSAGYKESSGRCGTTMTPKPQTGQWTMNADGNSFTATVPLIKSYRNFSILMLDRNKLVVKANKL